MNSVRWTVIPPPGYRITTQETKMQTDDLFRPKAAYLRVWEILTKNVFGASLLPVPEFGGVSLSRRGVQLPSAQSSMEADEVTQMVQQRVPVERPMPPQVPPRAGRPVQQAEPPTMAQPPAEMGQQKYAGVRLVERGRVTLPVDLVPTAVAARARHSVAWELQS